MSTLFGSSSTPVTNTSGDISKDVAISQPPEDSISDIRFSPTQDALAVSSWDKKVRIYKVSEQGQNEGMAAIDFDAPVLNCAWSDDGTMCVGVGADKTIRILDAQSGGAPRIIQNAHEAPIRTSNFVTIQNQSILVTGSWDRKIKYWDVRQDNPVATVECQERIYCADAKKGMLVVGCADRYINIIDLNAPDKFYKTMQSPLKYQTRVVSCFTEANGFAVGSVEGRCAIQYVEEKDSSLNFSFKCHRDTPTSGVNKDVSSVYAVNAISYHPIHGTFSTAGSDGTFHIWDGNSKHRLKGYPNVGAPITSTDFNRQGTIFAYAVSYDWSQGYQKNNQQQPVKVMLHGINPEEVRPKGNKPGTRR